MEITPEDIDKFRRIWREEFKEEISEDEARLQIRKLDAIYLFLYGWRKQNRRRKSISTPASLRASQPFGATRPPYGSILRLAAS
jgi:hypothetical protein